MYGSVQENENLLVQRKSFSFEDNYQYAAATNLLKKKNISQTLEQDNRSSLTKKCSWEKAFLGLTCFSFLICFFIIKSILAPEGGKMMEFNVVNLCPMCCATPPICTNDAIPLDVSIPDTNGCACCDWKCPGTSAVVSSPVISKKVASSNISEIIMGNNTMSCMNFKCFTLMQGVYKTTTTTEAAIIGNETKTILVTDTSKTDDHCFDDANTSSTLDACFSRIKDAKQATDLRLCSICNGCFKVSGNKSDATSSVCKNYTGGFSPWDMKWPSDKKTNITTTAAKDAPKFDWRKFLTETTK